MAGFALLGCTADEPTSSASPRPDGLVVTSFDFRESELLAEIYAAALEDEGIAVTRMFGLGPRELVLPALRNGLVDVVPEYLGSALDASRPMRPVSDSSAADAETDLRRALSEWDVDVLPASAAANPNVVAVETDRAGRAGLQTVSDLRSLPGPLVLGGPPECSTRPRCLAGLGRRYGLRFDEFVPLAGADLVSRALADGVIDVGVLFATDAEVAGGDVVVLSDDRALQPPDNVVPVVGPGAPDDPRIGRALDEVSAALTTDGLRFLNWRLANAGTTVESEARAWLVRHGLVER
jgi:osmoprotectant transport system substrate-binding protein